MHRTSLNRRFDWRVPIQPSQRSVQWTPKEEREPHEWFLDAAVFHHVNRSGETRNCFCRVCCTVC